MDLDVAVSEHDEVMARALVTIDQVRDLAIASMETLVDHDNARFRGPCGNNLPSDQQRRVVFILASEHDLDSAVVVLICEREQTPFQPRFVPVQRLEDGDGR